MTALLIVLPCAVSAAPGDILFSDDFEDGTLAPWTTTNAVISGVSNNYVTDLTFTDNAGGVGPFDYIPVPDAQGFDPLVSAYRIIFGGAMNGNSGSGNPNFNIVFRVRIE